MQRQAEFLAERPPSSPLSEIARRGGGPGQPDGGTSLHKIVIALQPQLKMGLPDVCDQPTASYRKLEERRTTATGRYAQAPVMNSLELVRGQLTS